MLDNLSDLGLYFVVQSKFGEKIVSDELVKNGTNIQVSKSNLNEYISKRLEYIQQKDKIFINEMKSGIFSVRIKSLTSR
jgi:hypothetical protein